MEIFFHHGKAKSTGWYFSFSSTFSAINNDAASTVSGAFRRHGFCGQINVGFMTVDLTMASPL